MAPAGMATSRVALRLTQTRTAATDLIDRKSTRLNSSHTVIYTLSLHDALPICAVPARGLLSHGTRGNGNIQSCAEAYADEDCGDRSHRSEEHTSELQSHSDLHSFPTRRSSDLCRSSSRSAEPWHPREWQHPELR